LDRSNGLERSILNVHFKISKKMSNALLKLHVPVKLAPPPPLPRRSLHATSGDPHIALSYVVVILYNSCSRETSACRANHHTWHTRRVIRRCTADVLLPRRCFISVIIIIVITIIVITFATWLNIRELTAPICTVRFICDILIF